MKSFFFAVRKRKISNARFPQTENPTAVQWESVKRVPEKEGRGAQGGFHTSFPKEVHPPLSWRRQSMRIETEKTNHARRKNLPRCWKHIAHSGAPAQGGFHASFPEEEHLPLSGERRCMKSNAGSVSGTKTGGARHAFHTPDRRAWALYFEASFFSMSSITSPATRAGMEQ